MNTLGLDHNILVHHVLLSEPSKEPKRAAKGPRITGIAMLRGSHLQALRIELPRGNTVEGLGAGSGGIRVRGRKAVRIPQIIGWRVKIRSVSCSHFDIAARILYLWILWL
jgi:hypothetical protein